MKETIWVVLKVFTSELLNIFQSLKKGGGHAIKASVLV
jgi:hypothetical protein